MRRQRRTGRIRLSKQILVLERKARAFDNWQKFVNANTLTQTEADLLFNMLESLPESNVRESLIRKLDDMYCECEPTEKVEGEGEDAVR